MTGRPMKGWVMAEPEAIDDDRRLRAWIERSLKFVESLPRK